VDADDDMAAEIEYSIYENQSSGVKELFGINRHTGGIFLLKSAVPWGKYINMVYLVLLLLLLLLLSSSSSSSLLFDIDICIGTFNCNWVDTRWQ